MHDGSARRIDGFDPAYRAPRHENAGEHPQNERKQDAQSEGYLNLLCELIKIVDILPHQQMIPAGQGLERRAEQWSVRHLGLPLWRIEVALPFGRL